MKKGDCHEDGSVDWNPAFIGTFCFLRLHLPEECPGIRRIPQLHPVASSALLEPEMRERSPK